MDKDLVNGKIGSVGNYDLAFTGGKIVVSLGAEFIGSNLTLSLSIGPKEILDLIAAKIGGPIPAEVAKFLEDALALT